MVIAIETPSDRYNCRSTAREGSPSASVHPVMPRCATPSRSACLRAFRSHGARARGPDRLDERLRRFAADETILSVRARHDRQVSVEQREHALGRRLLLHQDLPERARQHADAEHESQAIVANDRHANRDEVGAGVGILLQRGHGVLRVLRTAFTQSSLMSIVDAPNAAPVSTSTWPSGLTSFSAIQPDAARAATSRCASP